MFYLGARGDGDAIDAALALCCDQEVLVRREAAKLLAVLPTKGDTEVKHRIMGQFRPHNLTHQNDLMPPICQVRYKGDSLVGKIQTFGVCAAYDASHQEHGNVMSP